MWVTKDASAQQDPLFSHYLFNRLLINPGYAGSTNTLNGTLAYRQQFVGLDGAPQVQALTIHAPVQSRSMGLGFKVIHEKIGVTRQNSVSGIYTYHLRLAKGKLAFGVEGGIFNQSIDFPNLRKTIQDDNAVPVGKESVLVPDAAFGIYYYTEKLYLGGATYHLLQNKLNYSGYTGDDRALIAKLSNHIYLTGGYTFKAGEHIGVEPSLLLKYVAGAPLQIDMNVSSTFKEAFTVGGAYRTTGNAVVFLFQYNFKGRIKFGYAYDYIISELASFSNGSHEIMLSYNLPAKKKTQETKIDKDMIAEPYYTDTLPEDSLGISITSPIEDTIKVSEPAFVEIPADTPVEKILKDTLAVNIVELMDRGIVFRIQIYNTKEPIFLTPENFKGMENVREYKDEGWYKYFVGSSYDYDYANAVLINQVRSKGFKDALIVAFKEGKIISVKEALKLLKQ